MNEEELKNADEKIIVFTQIKRLNKIVDKLEQRIATLEKVLQSYAKCIGEMREEKTDV
jgi:exonuclease VII small subunit